jgi:hypothetical protein
MERVCFLCMYIVYHKEEYTWNIFLKILHLCVLYIAMFEPLEIICSFVFTEAVISVRALNSTRLYIRFSLFRIKKRRSFVNSK